MGQAGSTQLFTIETTIAVPREKLKRILSFLRPGRLQSFRDRPDKRKRNAVSTDSNTSPQFYPSLAYEKLKKGLLQSFATGRIEAALSGLEMT
jgi:hypothetical protein